MIFVHEQILVVKRVIGIPGDVVEGHDLKVFVNGKLLEEGYVEHIAKPPLGLKTLDTFGYRPSFQTENSLSQVTIETTRSTAVIRDSALLTLRMLRLRQFRSFNRR